MLVILRLFSNVGTNLITLHMNNIEYIKMFLRFYFKALKDIDSEVVHAAAVFWFDVKFACKRKSIWKHCSLPGFSKSKYSVHFIRIVRAIRTFKIEHGLAFYDFKQQCYNEIQKKRLSQLKQKSLSYHFWPSTCR